jgi:putative chitinase
LRFFNMAEVFGNIGDQPVELTNAASEATLKALLEVARAQFAAQGRGKGSKQDLRAQKELEKKLNSLAAAAAKNSKAFTNKAKAVNAAQKAVAEETKSRQISTREARKQAEDNKKSNISFAKTLAMATSNLTQVARGLQNMGDSITSATSVLSGMVKEIPFFGGIIGSGMDMIAGAVDNAQKSFMQAASVGANFQGSFDRMISNASDLGLTFDQFGGIISRNGDALRFLGTSVAEGTKRFTEIGRAFRSSNLQDELAYLGFNTETINEGMLNYTVQLQRAGVNVRNLAPEELVERTGQYLKNLDAVSKLTGQSRKELEQQRMERQRDIRVRATQNRLQDDSSRQIYQSLLDITRNMSPVVEKAFKDSFFGVIDSDEAQNMAVFGSEALNIIQQVGGEALRTGNLTTEGADQIIRALANVGVDIQQEDLFRTIATVQGSIGEMGVGLANGAQLQGRSIAEIINQQDQELSERERLARETDPANIVKTQQQLAVSSNEMNKTLLMLGDTLLNMVRKFNEYMEKLLKWVQKFINDPMGTLNEMWDNLKKAIRNGISEGIDYLRNKAIEIGEKIATGFVNRMPNWLQRMLGKDDRSDEEKELEVLERQKRALRQEIAARGFETQSDTERFQQLDEQIRNLNDQIKNGSSDTTANTKATTDLTNTLDDTKSAEDEMWDTIVDPILQLQSTMHEVDDTQAESNELTQQLLDNVDKLAKETKANTETVRAASTCELDYSSPQALFNSFAKIMVGGQPGVTDQIAGTSAVIPTEGSSIGVTTDTQRQMQAALQQQGITDPRAIANIMSQIQHESGFDSRSENLNYSGETLFRLFGKGNEGGNKVRFNTLQEAQALAAQGPEAVGNVIYGGRMGNAQDEGFLYRGRGLIQLTGKNNYKKFGDMIGVDLVSNPDLANDPQIAQQIAAAYFAEKQKQGVNLSDISAVGKAVGYAGGASETQRRAETAQAFLASTPSSTTPSPAQASAAMTSDTSQGAGGGNTPTTPTVGAPATSNNVMNATSSQLESLNTSMGQVVGLSREMVDLQRKTISALKELSDNV